MVDQDYFSFEFEQHVWLLSLTTHIQERPIEFDKVHLDRFYRDKYKILYNRVKDEEIPSR